jgi:ribosome biogenesis GTPase / thiamine phosphate phosphatase
VSVFLFRTERSILDHDEDSAGLQGLLSIGLSNHFLQQRAAWAAAGPGRDPDALLWRITEIQREGLTLHDGSNGRSARLLPALRERLAGQADAVAVGDWVLVQPDAQGDWWVHERLAPLNQLARRLHDGRDKVERVIIVSNVDTALLVMGLDGDFNVRRLERFVALVRMAGVEPLVVLSKADLCSDPASRLAAAQAVLPAGTLALALDLRGDAARAALRPWLEPGRTLVLLGASGAGKSTLTNTLATAAAQATGGNRKGDGRGRHTTTARSLHRTAEGACIIDTPGLRTLRLDTDEAALAQAFDDIATLAARCRFRDCRHDGEPGCAVREAVASERLKNFHKLQREARRDTMSALERKVQVAQWKVRGRAGKARALDKRGGD